MPMYLMTDGQMAELLYPGIKAYFGSKMDITRALIESGHIIGERTMTKHELDELWDKLARNVK